MKKLLTGFLKIFTSNRAKSLYWRSLMMFIAALLKYIADAAPMTPDIPTELAVTIGLVFGEVSKALNNRYGLKK